KGRAHPVNSSPIPTLPHARANPLVHRIRKHNRHESQQRHVPGLLLVSAGLSRTPPRKRNPMTPATKPIGVDLREMSMYVAHDRASGPTAIRFSPDHPGKVVAPILNERADRPASVANNRRPEPPGFLSAYPGYGSTRLLDRLRATEYSYLDTGRHI